MKRQTQKNQLRTQLRKNKDLVSKAKDLSKELEKAKSLVDRFTLSSNKLYMMIKSQQAIFDKAG